MEQLTRGETTLMIVTTIFGILVFVAVCAAIYFLFKRLERQDRAETERHQAPQDDTFES